MAAASDPSVLRFRESYRREECGQRYSGWAHFAFTTLASLGVIALCLYFVDQPTALELLTVPLVMLYSNLAEYAGHRGPMHHPFPGLGLVYRRHAKQHHRFFSHRDMNFEDSSDFKAVLFPPVMIVFFLVGFGFPLWLLLYLVATENAAWLAVATAVAYFLNYEWLHFAYHCDPDSPVGRLPGIRALRRLHRDHHDPRLMARYNFNITYPIGDWLFGTRYRPEAEEGRQGGSRRPDGRRCQGIPRVEDG